eukprot:792830-Alexandrium_andersonii.AAC.1
MEPASWRLFRDVGPPHAPPSSADSESARKSGAERAPRELRGPISRSFLGPRSSRFERLKRCCVFQRADCGCGITRSASSPGGLLPPRNPPSSASGAPASPSRHHHR